jgi:endonuclease-3
MNVHPHRTSSSVVLPDLYLVEKRLRESFGQPRHGNKSNPLDELLYILLSLQTTQVNCERSYRSLRRAFPRWSLLAAAAQASIRRTINFAGLGKQRSKKIAAIVRRIHRDFGSVTLSGLKKLTSEQAESYLTSLPGVGKKTARCILMYSLGRAVFPLDTHCARILKRLGFEIPDGSLRKCEDQIQCRIPAKIRYSLHVTMISLGRNVCTSKRPQCGSCPLLSMCPTGQSMADSHVSQLTWKNSEHENSGDDRRIPA